MRKTVRASRTLYELVPLKDEDLDIDFGLFTSYREAMQYGDEYFPQGYEINEYDDERDIEGGVDLREFDEFENLQNKGVDADDFWELEAKKDVRDSDGFWTEYCLYYNVVTDQWATVFGDSDIYKPEQGYFDAEFDSEKEARDWFDSYEGFEDDNF